MLPHLTAKTKTMKKLLIAVAALCVAAAIPAAQATSPKREMRGVWISTHISLYWPNRTSDTHPAARGFARNS